MDLRRCWGFISQSFKKKLILNHKFSAFGGPYSGELKEQVR